MCGIAGRATVRLRDPLPAHLPQALAHRGPDSQAARPCEGPGWRWDLVHSRLSIVDLSDAGNQPIANEDETIHLIFNGEIYNFAELRRYCEAKGHVFRSKMDGEVILHLWEMEGISSLRRLNGIFSIALADSTRGEVVIARDVVGVKPLFYVIDDDTLWFGSELEVLQAADAPLGPHDVVALAQFLSFLWIPDPRTPFANARSLEPGQALRWTPGGTELITYDSLLDAVGQEHEPLAPEVAVGELRDRFREAAQRQLMADVPIGLMASGGVDSGLLWWAASEGLDKAFTIEWAEESDNERLRDDTDAVRQLETRFGTKVDYIPGEEAATGTLPASGDIFADPAFDLTRLIARRARSDGFKVLLSGQGGDELFCGYRRQAMVPLIQRLRLGSAGRLAGRALQSLPTQSISLEYLARIARATGRPDRFASYMDLCTFSTAQERAVALGTSAAEVSDEVVWARHREVYDRVPSGASFLRRIMCLDLCVYLPGLGLSYVDRGGMEFGIEIRVPWLDLELVRWSLGLPDSLLLRGGKGKWLSRELASRELSHQIAQRAKRGFAAPSRRIAAASSGRTGELSFRQGSYFARAKRILDAYLSGRVHAA